MSVGIIAASRRRAGGGGPSYGPELLPGGDFSTPIGTPYGGASIHDGALYTSADGGAGWGATLPAGLVTGDVVHIEIVCTQLVTGGTRFFFDRGYGDGQFGLQYIAVGINTADWTVTMDAPTPKIWINNGGGPSDAIIDSVSIRKPL